MELSVQEAAWVCLPVLFFMGQCIAGEVVRRMEAAAARRSYGVYK